jgi:hypothetical protein
VGDPGIRSQLRSSYGFCTIHAYQWLKQTNVLATATIYVDVLTRLLEDLRAVPFHPASRLADVASFLGTRSAQGRDSGALAARGRCPVCRVVAETEAMLVQALLTALPEPAFLETYRSSPGMCFLHLRRALTQASDEATFATLRDVAIAHEEGLLVQLREIIRRSDYRFMDEPVGEERGAAKRAVHHVAGASGMPCEDERRSSG